VATNHNFRVKNGLEVAGTEIVNSSGVLQLASGLTSSTQNAGTNNTTLATTAFVTAAITAIGNGKIDWTTDQGSTNIHAGNYINTTYSVGDGGLTTNDFTNADHSKLNAIEASATADQTDAEIRAAVEAATDSNVFTNADHTKLNAIEASATTDQTDAEIRTAVEAATDSNVFTDADHSKLNAIEASATADQTGAQIKALYEAESNAYTDTKNSKLAGIEASATADQSNAEIRAAVEAATDSNVFTDTDHSKLNAIEASATADQTNAEIRTAVEAASDSNVFTDADHSKLNAIEASADVTDTANVVAALSAGTGVAISGGGAISVTAVALTTVQTASSQSAHLALTAQEGDIVVRSDENKTYCHNGGSAGNMNDYTLLATPTDAVLSVNGNTGAVSAAQIAAAVEAASNSNTFTDADHSKLNAIEASATADQTNAEIRTAVEAASDSNVFTDADHTKLNAIEASATADQTNAEIRAAIEAATDSNAFTDADHSKLNAIEASADVTDTTNVVAALTAGTNVTIAANGTIASTDTNTTYSVGDGELSQNNFTNADHSKLNAIEASATADQTDAEIRAAVEAATDSNVFTNADHTKLNAIEASADVTDTANVTAAGALMDSELTSIASIKALNQALATSNSPTFAALTITGAITSAAKNVGTQTITATAPSSASGFPNGHVWYVV
jgi:hypothetical protein|tara:strand:+ start:1036 stop:3081 length:2046 start_codon:yes stop_codon:yes gene_type:complete